MRITASRLILCFYAISFHIMVKHVQCDWLIKCGDCKCKWNSGKKTADCKNITLAKIPQYLSSELQVLDLSLNRITIIDSEAFLKADLQNLHKLFMRNCSLEIIHPNGLEGLEILIELDFSNNVIKSLPKDCFVSLVKLRSLILNNNQIETLENGLFRNLKYLHKVELTDNRIAIVGTDVFVNLPFLSQIFLSSNRLTFLRKETFEKLKRLASLSLESNPWNCTCDLQPFRDFTLQRNLYTPPTSCHYPPQLRGMLWTDNQPEAFACKPKIIYPSRGASINTSKENVTLICRVHASPNTMIAWDYNKQIYSSSSSNYQARVNIQLLREENNISDNNNSNNRNSNNVNNINNINDNNNNINNNNNNNNNEFGRDIFISRLTIFGAEKSDEGIYTCVAENAGGKDEVQMNLLVQKHNHQSILLQNNLIIIICLMVLGLLSASIFLAMVTCCVYKRFKSINHGHHTNGGNDQHHLQHQKRNFNGLNVVNSVNDTYHHHHQRDDANYVEIKQTKVSSSGGNLSAVGSINNFTDLNDTRGYYYENSNQEAVTQQAQQLNHHQQHQQQKHHQFQELHNVQPNCSKLPERHKQENTSDSTLGVGGGGGSGDYQPDLLPYIPQSISFNSSSLYSYAVNQPTLYDNQPHQQQQTNEHLYTQNMMGGGGHQSAPFGRHHPYHQHQLQQFGATNKPHHRSALHLEDQIDDLRYGNNFRRNSSKYETEQHHQPSEQGHGQNPNEYLHYGIMGLPGLVTGETSLQTTGLPPSLVDNTNEMAAVTGLGTLTRRSGNSLGDAGLGIGFSGGSGSGTGYEDQSSELDDLGRQPIVRTSPSLNFLSNYYQRRELL